MGGWRNKAIHKPRAISIAETPLCYSFRLSSVVCPWAISQHCRLWPWLWQHLSIELGGKPLHRCHPRHGAMLLTLKEMLSCDGESAADLGLASSSACLLACSAWSCKFEDLGSLFLCQLNGRTKISKMVESWQLDQSLFKLRHFVTHPNNLFSQNENAESQRVVGEKQLFWLDD